VLDVGCGTGTLALAAKERVGPTGRVVGIDPGPRQIGRARSKAARQGLDIDFRVGVIERLELPDQSFDAALSTMMMHHLPDDLKRRGLAEIVRTLKSGGRLVVADFKRPEPRAGRPVRFGAGESGIQDLPGFLAQAGSPRSRPAMCACRGFQGSRARATCSGERASAQVPAVAGTPRG